MSAFYTLRVEGEEIPARDQAAEFNCEQFTWAKPRQCCIIKNAIGRRRLHEQLLRLPEFADANVGEGPKKRRKNHQKHDSHKTESAPLT